MKVITIGKMAYRILTIKPYSEQDNIEIHKRTAAYDVLIQNDKQQQLYFCDKIEDAEFTEMDISPEKIEKKEKKKLDIVV
jgi:hypothetical protein